MKFLKRKEYNTPKSKCIELTHHESLLDPSGTDEIGEDEDGDDDVEAKQFSFGFDTNEE